MLDIVLETARAVITAGILGYLVWMGSKARLGHQGGWPFIITGFSLILMGSLFDITDNFEGLNKFVIIGDTKAEAWLEKVAGALVGFCLLAIGFWKWLPALADRRKAEQALQTAYQDLAEGHHRLVAAQDQLVRKERLATIGQLSGSVAHDLRSPLGAISNAAYYLRKKISATEFAQSNPKIEEFIGIIDDEVQYTNQIISDLLGFTRVASPALSECDVAGVIESALAEIETQENVSVEKQFDADLPPVLADEDQLRRVFGNLAGNSRDAMPKGGDLTITAKQIDGLVEVGFSDTGVGISDEDIGKIFEPLFTTKARGTGLGLSICQLIVSQHQGTIDVTSEPGQGTIFTVRLPLSLDGNLNGQTEDKRRGNDADSTENHGC